MTRRPVLSRPQPASVGGFTLIEIMLAVVISSIILSSAYGAFRISRETSEKAMTRQEALENCRNALALVSRSVAAAYLSPSGRWSLFRSIDGEDEMSGLPNDSLCFTTLSNDPTRTGERTSDYAEIEYFIDTDPETEGEWLVRRYDARVDEDQEKGGILTLGGYRIVSMDVWHFDDGEWKLEWNSKTELPTAVRIQMASIIDPGKPPTEDNRISLSNIVWLPHSRK